MNDEEIWARMRAGGALTTWGIFVLVGSFLGTCAVAASKSGNPNAGFEMGQSPWLVGALALGITLITLGQVKKMNARNALAERHRAANTTLKVEPDPEAGGPFRPGVKETAVLDPLVAAAEQSEREYDKRRGAGFLLAGGIVMAVTIIGMFLLMSANKGGGPSAVRENLGILGLSIFPFGLGLFLGIKGLLLRSK